MAARDALLVRRVRVKDRWPGGIDEFFNPRCTYAKTVKEISDATGIEASQDRHDVVITASGKAELEEAEAMVRLLFTHFQWEGTWWLFAIPSAVANLIALTLDSEVPKFSTPAVNVHITPYKPEVQKRCFLITGAESPEVHKVYDKLRKEWNHWRGYLPEASVLMEQWETRVKACGHKCVDIRELGVVESYTSSLDETAKEMSVDELKQLESQLEELEWRLRMSVKGVRQLREEKVERERQAEAERLCCVCLVRLKDMAMMPCQHMCVCTQCDTGLTVCPICRADIRQRFTLYL